MKTRELLLTAVLGPFGIVQLGSNPLGNGFIAALFIAFGLSLLGAFEITIPSPILTRLNQSSGQGGFAGTLLGCGNIAHGGQDTIGFDLAGINGDANDLSVFAL